MSQFVATVDRFEGDFAVLKHKDHEILLPKDDLPTDIAEGGLVTIITMSGNREKEQQKSRTQKVEEILNDILETSLGVETPAEGTVEQKQYKELKKIKGDINKMNQGIKEEIEEHKSHEK